MPKVKDGPHERLQEERNKQRTRKISPQVRRVIFERDNHQCQQCGNRTKLTIDHIFPFSRGGGRELKKLTATMPKVQFEKIRCNNIITI